MARKGKIPAHLRPYLFTKGRGKFKRRKKSKSSNAGLRAIARIRAARKALDRKTGRRSRLRNPPTALTSRRRVHRRGMSPREYFKIVAIRSGKTLSFDGAHFSNKHAARKFLSLELAATKARQLLKTFPVLRSYKVYVKRA